VFFNWGAGNDPSPAMMFLAQPLSVEVVDAAETIVVNSSKAFGAGAFGMGASDLNLWICSRPQGGSIAFHGGGILGLSVGAGSRQLFALSGVVQNLAVGTYEVGLCGYSNHDGWNSNDFGYTTAIVTK
jgi:hypothetical protein